jgi:hypothetical protein
MEREKGGGGGATAVGIVCMRVCMYVCIVILNGVIVLSFCMYESSLSFLSFVVCRC